MHLVTADGGGRRCQPAGRRGRRPAGVVLVIALLGTLSSIGSAAAGTESSWWTGYYPVSIGYGCDSKPYEPYDASCAGKHFHHGIDFAYPSDCYTTEYPVYAGVAGTVVEVGADPLGYGRYAPRIRLDGAPFDVIIGHVRAVFVQAGQHVAVGQLLALVGSAGNSTGCHIHFEVDAAGGNTYTSVNPFAYLHPRQPE